MKLKNMIQKYQATPYLFSGSEQNKTTPKTKQAIFHIKDHLENPNLRDLRTSMSKLFM